MLVNRRECQTALDAAATQFDGIEPGDPVIDLFSPTQHGRLAGSCYLLLRDAGTAVAILEQTARELQDQPKSQAVVLGNLALAHIQRGSCDTAVARLHEAIDVTARNRGEAASTLSSAQPGKCGGGGKSLPFKISTTAS